MCIASKFQMFKSGMVILVNNINYTNYHFLDKFLETCLQAESVISTTDFHLLDQYTININIITSLFYFTAKYHIICFSIFKRQFIYFKPFTLFRQFTILMSFTAVCVHVHTHKYTHSPGMRWTAVSVTNSVLTSNLSANGSR